MWRCSSCRKGQSAPTPRRRSAQNKTIAGNGNQAGKTYGALLRKMDQLAELHAVFGAPHAASYHNYHGVVALQERKFTFNAGVVGKFVIRQSVSYGNIGAHSIGFYK